MKVKEDQIRELELKVQVMAGAKGFLMLSYLNSSSVFDLWTMIKCGDSAFQHRPIPLHPKPSVWQKEALILSSSFMSYLI